MPNDHDLPEQAGGLTEEHRISAESAREALHATLEQMKAIEEMRRTLREIRDVNKLDSN